MWVRMSSQQPLGVVCAVTLPSSGPASARGGSRWLLSRVAVLGGAAPAPSAPSALEGSCGCSLAVLSPWPGGAASVPGPCLSPVPLRWPPVPGGAAVPVPGGTGRSGHEDPAAAELWDPLGCSGSALPFPDAPEGKASPAPAQGREGGDEPWAPGASAGAEPPGGAGPFSLLSCSFQTTGNRSKIRLKSGNFLCCSVLTPFVTAG